ncbi:hypothetical protein ID0475_14670 [Helicobacter pylori]
MGNLASGHFKPTNNIQEQHNDRTLSPSYLIPQEFRGQNEVNRYSKQAMILKNQIIENAHQTYLMTFKQKSQAKSYQWSLVVNIKNNTTMSDLEKLAEHFEVKYGFQCYQIAIHRDEGYMDENNQPHINHHAHMEFITLDKNTGKNRQRELRSNQLRQIQTEIAQILGMERGTDKRVSGTERIEPRKYAQMKNKERKERLKNAELIDRLIRSISEFGTNNKMLNQKIKAKNQKIDELQERPTTEQYSQLEQANSEQAQTIQAKDKEINTLKQENADLKNEITTALDTANYRFKEKKTTLQEAVKKVHMHSEVLSAIYHFLQKIEPNYVKEITEKYKDMSFFTTTFDIVKKLKELYSKIVEKLFGDENAKKDHQDILNAITELQERPTKQEIQAKEKELNTLKDKIQEQDKTINELNKKLQELEYNYRLERERMQAENKRLKDQGLEKIYAQKDYERLKEQHEKEIEALKKKIQEQDKYKTKSNALRYQQAKQKRAMKTKQTTTPTPSPTPQPTHTKRI